MRPRVARPVVRLALVAAALGSPGCVDRFETPSQNDDVPLLCGDGVDPDAFDPTLEARIEACRAAGPEACGGVINLRGDLEDTPIAVLGEIEGDLGTIEVRGATDPVILDSIEGVAVTPYFVMNFSLTQMGGAVTAAVDTTPRAYQLANSNGDLMDDVATLETRLESGGQSVSIRSQSGTAILSRISETEVRGRFTASMFVPGGGAAVEDDVVSGCFHVFAGAPTSKGM